MGTVGAGCWGVREGIKTGPGGEEHKELHWVRGGLGWRELGEVAGITATESFRELTEEKKHLLRENRAGRFPSFLTWNAKIYTKRSSGDNTGFCILQIHHLSVCLLILPDIHASYF